MPKQNSIENKKSRKFEKDLVAYSLAASAILLGTTGAKADVRHTDLGAGVVLNTDGDLFGIDFGNNGTTNFIIKFISSLNSTVSYIYALGINAKTGNASWNGSGSYAKALNKDDIVNTLTTWSRASNNNLAYYSIYTSNSTTTSTFTAGDFLGTSNKYVGVKFMIGADTHYGWIQVQVLSNSTSATITGYAYNDENNGPILAGQIPEAGSLALLALGAAGFAAWRKK